MENHTPRNFALQLGSLISLYLSVSFLLVLLFGIINIKFPDAIEGYWAIESASQSVRMGIAMLVVIFPTYLVLTRLVNRIRRTETSSAYLTLTKWLIYLSLLVGGAVLLGDLVAIILGFLNGELTQRFILKAVAVLAVVGIAMHYYILDARGFWIKHESKSIMFAIGAALVTFASIAYGIAYIETPAAVREMRLDETQVQDLREIQWRIEASISESGPELPLTLAEIYGVFPVPEAPEDREAYSYQVTATGFELCATFAHDSQASTEIFPARIDPAFPIKNADDWSYKAGRFCFTRIVNGPVPLKD